MHKLDWLKPFYHAARRPLEVRKRIRGSGNRISLGKSIVRRLRIDIRGDGNVIRIADTAILEGLTIRMQGNNHTLTIGPKAWFLNSKFFFEDNNCNITVGEACLANTVTLSAVENGSTIDVGSRVGLGEGCDIRTSDSHSILELKTGRRINPPGDVIVGEHAWIGKEAILLKGVHVGANSIIGLRSIVTKSIPKNCLAVGAPAKVIKTDVTWDYGKLPTE